MRNPALSFVILIATVGVGQSSITRYVQPNAGHFTQSVSLGQNSIWRTADGGWLVKFVELIGVAPNTTTYEGLFVLDTLLNIQSARRFALNGEGSQVVIGDVKPLVDGGYVVATAVNDTTLQIQYTVVERYAATHALKWQRTLRTDFCDPYPFDLHVPQGVMLIGDHFYVGHLACSFPNGDVIPSLTKLDSLGNVLWTRQYSSGASGGLTTTWVAVPTGIALSGNGSLVSLIDTSGLLQWTTVMWGNFMPQRTIATLEGGVATLFQRFIGNPNLEVAKVTSTGDTAWVREIVSADPPQALAITEDADSTIRVLWRTGLETHSTHFDATGAINTVTSWAGELGRFCWAGSAWNDGWFMMFRQNVYTDYQLTKHVPNSFVPCLEDAPPVTISAVVPPLSAAFAVSTIMPTLLPVATAMVPVPVSFAQGVCLSTSISANTVDRSKAVAWPVPADEELNLQIPNGESGAQCYVMDHSGRILWQGGPSSGGTVRINTASWPSGCYFATITELGNVAHIQVIVVH